MECSVAIVKLLAVEPFGYRGILVASKGTIHQGLSGAVVDAFV